MMKQLLLTVIIMLVTLVAKADLITKLNNNNPDWNDPQAWDCNCVPGPLDDVLIDAESIFISGAASVNSINITNASGLNNAFITLKDASVLSISNDLNLRLENGSNTHITFILSGNSQVLVSGFAKLTRPFDYVGSGELKMILESNSMLSVINDFELSYNNTNEVLDYTELHLQSNSLLHVGRDFTIDATKSSGTVETLLSANSQVIVDRNMTISNNSTSGSSKFTIENLGTLTVNTNLNFISSSGALADASLIMKDASMATVSSNINVKTVFPGAISQIILENASSLTAGQNVLLSPSGEQESFIDLKDNSQFSIVGNFFRFNNGRGNLDMSPTSTLRFIGTSTQILPSDKPNANLVSDEFYMTNVEIDNSSSGIAVNLETTSNGGSSVYNTLNLIRGMLSLNGEILSVENSDAAAIIQSGGSLTSDTHTDFSGGIRWNIGNSLSQYIYPFSNLNNEYIPLVVSPSSGSMGYFTVSTYPTDASQAVNNRPLPPSVQSFKMGDEDKAPYSVDRFWEFDKTGIDGVTDITFSYSEDDLSMNFNNMIGDESLIKAQRWNGSEWEIGKGTPDALSNQLTMNDISEFSPWSLGIGGADLPIKLQYFDVKEEACKIILDWATASEIEFSHFELQKSYNGKDFKKIAEFQGAQNSTTLRKYSFSDNEKDNPIRYYRLKMIDLDGSFEYAPLKIIKLSCTELAFAIELYPNPSFNEAINFSFESSFESGPAQLIVRDILGRKVYQQEFEMTSGQNVVKVDPSNLNAGMYFLQLFIEEWNSAPLKWQKN